MVILRKFHPPFSSLKKIEPINSSFIQYSYVEDDKYEMVESEKIKSHENEMVTYFRNGERISKNLFYQKTSNSYKVKKNIVVFLHEYNICFLDIYIQPNSQIFPIITVEFGEREERERYRPLEWFGKEIDEKLYNEKALWHNFQAVND